MYGVRKASVKHSVSSNEAMNIRRMGGLLPDWEGAVFQPVTSGAAHEEAASKGESLLSFLIKSFQDEGRRLPEPQIFIERACCILSFTVANLIGAISRGDVQEPDQGRGERASRVVYCVVFARGQSGRYTRVQSFGRGQVVRQRTLDPRSQVRILAPEPARYLTQCPLSS